LMRVYVGGVENASFEIIVLLAGMWKPLVRRAVTAAARNKIYPARTVLVERAAGRNKLY
jgi:hypothetical protein